MEWRVIRELMTRPQPVTVPMVMLFAIIPFYLVIGASVAEGPVHIPELPLDRAIPLLPGWSLVYGSLFLAAILPVLVVHQQEHVDRTIRAFLWMWLVAYFCFFFYPTGASRPAQFAQQDFGGWGLKVIYASDFRYNCLPSLHVAQCFLAALTCSRIHRGVGAIAMAWAALVALSTLFTKQHYVLDVVTGAMLACAAYAIFIRGYPRDAIPERERRYAPMLALGAAGIYGIILIVFFVLYSMGVQP